MHIPDNRPLRQIGVLIIIIFALALPRSFVLTSNNMPQQSDVALISADEAGLGPIALFAGKEEYMATPHIPVDSFEATNNSAELVTTNASFVADYVPADQYGSIQNPYPCATFPNDAKGAVEKALLTWEGLLNPPFPTTIHVQVCWSYLSNYDALSLVKIPNYIYRFPEIPSEDILYPVSLANALSGEDLDGSTPEIAILINSRQSANFHYAVDTAAPATKYNFVSVFSHNIAHGLGLTSSFSVYKNSTGTFGRWGVSVPGKGMLPLSFDTFVTDQQGHNLTTSNLYQQNSSALAQVLQSNALFFKGETTRLASNGTGARLYAPNPYAAVDSIHHLDKSYSSTENALMAPILAKGQPILAPGPLVKTILLDMGWDVIVNTPAAPRRLLLSATSFKESEPLGTAVITLSSTDPNPGETFTYSLVPGIGSTDNAAFKIDGNKLRTALVFNYEVKSKYLIRIRTTDKSGFFLEKSFTINIININEPPTDITLSSTEVLEGLPAKTIIGTLSTIDDDGGVYTYSLDCPGADNSRVTISNKQLLTAAVLNYESRQNLSVCVKSTDTSGSSLTKNFTINVINVNESATMVTLLPGWVRPGLPANNQVGAFLCNDPDIGDFCTYTLPDGLGDNHLFLIQGVELRAAAAIDRAVGQTYTIHVLARDKANLGPEVQAITITVREPVDAYLPVISR